MKKYLLLTVLFVLVSVLHLFAQSFEKGQLYVYVQNPTSIPTFTKDGDKIIVQCSNQELQSVMTTFEVYSFERAFPIVDNFTQTEKYDLEKVYLLKCNGDEVALMQIFNDDFLDSYNYTEMVPFYHLTSTPNDYHLWDGNLGANYALDIIKAKNAWNITTGTPTSVIGITDNGFDVTNPELTGKIDFCINNSNPSATHGTFVAGIAAANTNNSLGMSSIGYNCHLALDGRWAINGGYNAILNFSLQGIKVVNVSWGSCSYSRAEEDVINLAFDNGTLVVAGAGNGTNPDGSCNNGGCPPDCNGYFYPASFDRVMSVTSVGPNLSHISSTGAIHTHNNKVDVSAAGYEVISIGRDDNGNFACFKSSGTSFAGPYVAGLAGLIYSINPDFTPEQVYHIIKTTTQNIDAQNPQFVGLIGTGLIDAEAAVIMAQDIANDPGNNYNVYNGQNILWDENNIKVINEYIHIYTGGTLTIKGDVYLKNNAVIIVERGASLYIDGAYLTSHGTTYWEGIKVLGNYYLDQVPQSNQGFLKVYNNSTIANANIGIKVGDVNEIGSSLSFGGGIILLENSTLINNKKAVVFTPYHRPGGLQVADKNLSYIRNIDFTWDKPQIPNMVFLSLYNVNIFDISGNRFSNKMGNNALVSENNGIGILSNSASFTVKSLNGSSGNIDTQFYNLYYGVKSNASNPVQTFRIENAFFIRTFNGIYANGSNGLRITNNKFQPLNIPDINIPAENAYGLYINGCTGYTIENNVFENWLGLSQIRKIVGIIVNNSGSAYNLINDNSFSNLKVGVLAQNQNRGSLSPEAGLVIKCNYFSNNKNDIAVTGTQNGLGYGIGYYQGTNQSVSSPAGNLFGHAFPGSTSDYHNELQNIIYVHHSSSQIPELIPWYYTTSTISLFPSQWGYQPGVSCSYVIPAQKEELKAFVEAKEAAIATMDELLTESVDKGNTVLLENTVFSSTPDESYDVYQELIETGSYVSKIVLSAAIQKEDVLNETMIRDVLVSNPHAAKSPELMNLVTNRGNQLPEYMMAQIEDGFNTLSARELLELQISMHRLEASLAEKELIYLYRTDTTASIDSLLLFLSSRNRPDAFIQLAFEYLKINEISEALNSISSINTSDLGVTELELRNKMLNYLQFHNVLINEGRSIAELNTSEIAELEALAEGDDLVASCSRSILIANGLLEYNEPIQLPNDMFKSTKVVRNNKVVNNSQLTIYPNPASQWITVEYDLQLSGNINPELNIIDATGRVVKSIELSGNKNSVIVDLTTLQKGIYFCNLVSDKHSISRKLTIQ